MIDYVCIRVGLGTVEGVDEDQRFLVRRQRAVGGILGFVCVSFSGSPSLRGFVFVGVDSE